MLPIVLSFGAVYALIPLLIIIILIAAAAGLSRGYDIFSIFGIGVLAGIGGSQRGRGTLGGKTAFKARIGGTAAGIVTSKVAVPVPVKTMVGGKVQWKMTAMTGKEMVSAGIGGAKGRIGTSRAIGQTTQNLTNEITATGKSVAGVNKGRARWALGAIVGTGTFLSAGGMRVMGGGSYGKALKNYERAEQGHAKAVASGNKAAADRAQAEKEKYAHKMQLLRESHNINPTTGIEFRSAHDAIQYEIRHPAQSGPASTYGRRYEGEGRLSSREIGVVKNRLLELSRMETMSQKIETLSASYPSVTVTPARFQALQTEVRRLAEDFHKGENEFDKAKIINTKAEAYANQIQYTASYAKYTGWLPIASYKGEKKDAGGQNPHITYGGGGPTAPQFTTSRGTAAKRMQDILEKHVGKRK